MSSKFILPFQNCFCYFSSLPLAVLVFINLMISLLISTNNPAGILVGTALNQLMNLAKIETLTILNLPVLKCSMFSHLYWSVIVFFSRSAVVSKQSQSQQFVFLYLYQAFNLFWSTTLSGMFKVLFSNCYHLVYKNMINFYM